MPTVHAVDGVFAARIKFESGHGAHGAFWLQKTGSTGTEIDVAEYFGDGRSDGGLSNGVYLMTGPSAHVRSGGMIKNSQALLGRGKTPSNSWHVYSVQWGPTGLRLPARRDPYLHHEAVRVHLARGARPQPGHLGLGTARHHTGIYPVDAGGLGARVGRRRWERELAQ